MQRNGFEYNIYSVRIKTSGTDCKGKTYSSKDFFSVCVVPEMLLIALALLNAAAFINGNRFTPQSDSRDRGTFFKEKLKPYSFSYKVLSNEGLLINSRSETSDEFGNVRGSYSLNNDNGYFRSVYYTADKDGYRAIVDTNEQGTSKQNPANVVMRISKGPPSFSPVSESIGRRTISTTTPRPAPRPVRPGVTHSLEKDRGKVVPKE